MRPVILIPARLASTRLPEKPLAQMGGMPMIVQVWRRAIEADIGPVYVACDAPSIAEAVEKAGGEVVMTKPEHPSGSDRIFEALQIIDAQRRHDVIVNLQGDVPTIEPETIRAVLRPLADPGVDIATLACEITRDEERSDPSVVKPVLTFCLSSPSPLAGEPFSSSSPLAGEGWGGGWPVARIEPVATSLPNLPPQGGKGPGGAIGRALYFSRASVPAGDGPLYHHIGIYAYRRAALVRFVRLPPSPLELREKLEQLRAIEAGMRVDVALVDAVPLGVDTPEQLERARQALARDS